MNCQHLACFLLLLFATTPLQNHALEIYFSGFGVSGRHIFKLTGSKITCERSSYGRFIATPKMF